MNDLKRDTLKLKAAIEFGSENVYTVKNGGLGPTLVVDAETRERARVMRAKVPTSWEGLYTIVIYTQEESDPESAWLYDPNLT